MSLNSNLQNQAKFSINIQIILPSTMRSRSNTSSIVTASTSPSARLATVTVRLPPIQQRPAVTGSHHPRSPVRLILPGGPGIRQIEPRRSPSPCGRFSGRLDPVVPISRNNSPTTRRPTIRSPYHAGCQQSISPSRIPVFQVPSSARYHHPSPSSSPTRLLAGIDPMDDPEELTRKRVGDYLLANSSFLEDHVLEHVDVETIERWLIRRTRKERVTRSSTRSINSDLLLSPTADRKVSLSRWKFCVHADKRQMLQSLMHSLATQPQPGRILWELACCVASAVGADGFILHLVDPDNHGQLRVFKSCQSNDADNKSNFELDADDAERLHMWESDGNNPPTTPKSHPHTIASYVAEQRHTIIIQDIRQPDLRFPAGSLCLQEGGVHVLGAPVIQNDGSLTGVIELYRRLAKEGENPRLHDNFHEEDEEIASSYLVWGGIALHYADMYFAMAKQRNLHQFLLTVVRSIFQDMVSIDTLIAKVMNFAQKLVDADRASLFLVDHKAEELYARIFDMGDGLKSDGLKEIRFPLGTGIAGHVAVTGEVLNIANVYADPRFNRSIDQLTGYHTRSILSMPIFIQGRVIGVVQMVNKHHGAFTAEDEESFELFAVYCGLALHHAKLYDRISLSEQKNRVALELLSYHTGCSEEEFQHVKHLTSSPVHQPATVGLDQFWFSAFSIGDLEKVNSAVYMFVDLFGLTRFDRDSLIRFTMTVRKNYRRVPYHNWTHGFSVANSMYAILKRAPDTFEALEAVSLYVGSLCHDLDHRGKNNKFMLDTASPLASIYTTSTMEHHHFNQTITILQQEGHNIFAKLDSDEYKKVLKNIKHCILATDLATFFPTKAKLAGIVQNNEFSWQNKDHRLMLQAITMTGSDLCASSKPWDTQSETVKVIFEEFYSQGDEERKVGREPIPMMDRTKLHLQPDSQVGFISGICIPCYGLLHSLIPETKPMLEGCESNLQRWKELAKENELVDSNKQDDSAVAKNTNSEDHLTETSQLSSENDRMD